MDAHQERSVLDMYNRMRGSWPMEDSEYKRHLLNHISYSHAYLSGASVELAQANPTALCEAAMHAAACAWCLADYHNEATPPEPVPAAAWEGVANRWVKAVEKWTKYLKANQAAAYQAPIRERAALKELPAANGRRSTAKSSPPGRATEPTAVDTPTDWLASGMPSSGPITGSAPNKREPKPRARKG